MRTHFLPRNSLSEMSSPVVAGSLKSGALSPTSTAQAAPTMASPQASNTPKKSKPFWYLVGLYILLSPFSNKQFCTLHFAILLLHCVTDSSDHPIGSIQRLGGNLNPNPTINFFNQAADLSF